MKNKRISLALKISVLVMVISLTGISLLAYLSYLQARDIFIENTARILEKNLENNEIQIKENLETLVKNVNFLSYNPSIHGYFRAFYNKYHYDEKNNKTLDQYEEELIALFKLFIGQNNSLFQIRILDANGKELIKLIQDKNKLEVVPKNFLQDKSHRDYFKEAIKLSENQIYISKINLNREFKVIELPFKPTIRIAKVIYHNNKKAGVLVANANIKTLFNFDFLDLSQDEETYIANQDGYYILNKKNPNKEFGFEFGFDYKVYKDFPQIKKLFEEDIEKISYIDRENGIILQAKKIYITPDRYIVLLKKTTTKAFQQKSDVYIKKLIVYIVLIVVIITILTIITVRKLTKPILKLAKIAKEIAKTKGRKRVKIKIKTKDEIEELAKSFETMLQSLIKSQKELEKFAEKLEKEVEEKTRELKKLNENLQKEVERQVKELREKDQALAQQAKLAAMGEMIGAIAHQWRQPLNYLALNIQLLEQLADEGELDKKTVEEIVEKMINTINFMSNTIDDFRSFFRKDKEAVVFDVKEAVEKTIELLKSQLENRGIQIETNLNPVKVKGYKNEFRQVILNLISNARDAVSKRMKEEGIQGKIYVETKKENGYAVIKVKDNGGGIPEEIKDRIFEPYFTTKEEGQGTGMGLYMSKQIIERMGGQIYFENTDDGVEFVIKLKAEENGEN